MQYKLSQHPLNALRLVLLFSTPRPSESKNRGPLPGQSTVPLSVSRHAESKGGGKHLWCLSFFDIPLATQDPHLPLELTRLARTLHSLHRFTEPATPESVTTIPYSLFPARALPASRFRAPRAVGSPSQCNDRVTLPLRNSYIISI